MTRLGSATSGKPREMVKVKSNIFNSLADSPKNDDDELARLALNLDLNTRAPIATAQARRDDLSATFNQVASNLERYLDSNSDDSVIDILTQCLEALPAPPEVIFTKSDSKTNTLRSMEKIRRQCAKILEDERCDVELRTAVKLVLEGIIRSLEAAGRKASSSIQLLAKTVLDLTGRAIESLCVLARVTLVPNRPETHTNAYDYLLRGVAIIGLQKTLLSNKKEPDTTRMLLNVLRCTSGHFWNHAILLHQANNYGVAIRFLVQSCELDAQACEMARAIDVDGGEPGGLACPTWKMLKAQICKRWEVLADCYIRIGDRKLAYRSLIESVKAYDFGSLCLSAASLSPSQIILDPAYRRLASLVERATHIAVSDLFIPDKASLRHPLGTSEIASDAVGLLLEWQVTALEDSLWKHEIRPVVALLLQDALDMYGDDFPVRRARILIRQLEIAYRTDDIFFPTADVVAEIHLLLSNLQSASKDAALADFRVQYEAASHMWMAFHTHRSSERHTNAIALIFQQATLANKLLREIFPIIPSVKSPKHSPKQATTQTLKVATRTSPRKKASTVKQIPVTPKRRGNAIYTSPKVVQQQPSSSSTAMKGEALAVDSHISKTVEMLAQLLGLLGHSTLRIQFLSILQRMTAHSPHLSADQFIRASVDAATEYLNLGKFQRALAIYAHAVVAVNGATSGSVSDEVRVSLLLHYAEALALNGKEARSARVYEEARNVAETIEDTPVRSTAGRIRARIQALERSAHASKVFSLIQDDPHKALSSLRQSLRLWHRAFDTLARLSPSRDRVESNPFDMSSLTAALPNPASEQSQKIGLSNQKMHSQKAVTDTIQWRIAKGLLGAHFDLARAYFQRGSVRGAEYFLEQARELADSVNSPTIVSRVLARKGELQLHQRNIKDAVTSLLQATELLHDLPGIDAANVIRLRARHSQLIDNAAEAKALYLEAMSMVSELENNLSSLEAFLPSPRKSIPSSPGRPSCPDVLAPEFLAAVLKQQIWLLRDEPRSKAKGLLERFSVLPPSRQIKAEELAILAKLALHDAHVQFRADLFLSSVTETTIAIPMGLSSHDAKKLSAGARQMLETLSTAEKMFWENLKCVSTQGQALHAREAAVSLALIRAFQTSLGKGSTSDARVSVKLLDASAAITLHREYIDAIDQKFPQLAADDLVWLSNSVGPHKKQRINLYEASDEDNSPAMNLQDYWGSVRARCIADHNLQESVSDCRVDLLPANWTVVNISITEDKSTMFFSRQRSNSEPLLFCVPLERHGRKEDAEEQFVFDSAKKQLEDILRESDQSSKDAKEVSSDDRAAKAAWWAKRVSLDKRMRDLLENMEFCWLGAFKTILHEPVKIPPDLLGSLRTRFDKIFHRNLVSDKKRASRMKLDDSLMECFAALSPKCRDEELEDLVYFVLDLYQFHGLHIPLSEVDIDQITAELRTALEEYVTKSKGRVEPVKDAHLFLVLDKNVQGIPWESIPILRGKSISRIPSVSFLVDRLEFAKMERMTMGEPVVRSLQIDRAVVNPKKTYFMLNPSGDLTKSEERFKDWVKDMTGPAVGWQGIVGQVPSEQELLAALNNKDLVIYIGHGGAEQYVRSNKIKHLPRCAATMLWGCSSGLMRDMGDFDRTGTPYNYMMAGCPTLVACLWDVTDNELDKISLSVFEKLRLDSKHVKSWGSGSTDDAKSVVTAVCQSRDVCKLKYLTGAAPVVYGIPFYL